jgi:hypothetical protein
MQYTYDAFNGCLGQPFKLFLDEAAHELELILVERLPDRAGTLAASHHEAYSLVFRGAPDLLLDQRIYPLRNQTLGEMELFLVPIGPDEKGMRFEAVFN